MRDNKLFGIWDSVWQMLDDLLGAAALFVGLIAFICITAAIG